MKNTKLISLLKTFSKKEIKEFEKFLSSPYHTASAVLSPLFDELIRYYPQFDHPELTKEKLYAKLYEGTYNDEYIRKMMSRLYASAKDFLINEELKERVTERELLLLSQFRKRNLDTQFTGLAQQLEKDVSASRLAIEEFLDLGVGLTGEQTDYYRNKEAYGKTLHHAGHQVEAVAAQFVYYLIKGLIAKETASRAYAGGFYPPVLEALEKNFNLEEFLRSASDESTALKLMVIDHYIYLSLCDPDDMDMYEKAKAAFLLNIEDLSLQTRHDYFKWLSSAITSQSKYAKSEEIRQRARTEGFKLIKLRFEHNAVFPEGKKTLDIQNFVIILKHSLMERDFEWADKFVEDYVPRLEPEHIDNMKEYSIALVECIRGNFEKSLEHLIKVKPTTPFIKFDVRELNLVLFYELELYEEARYLISNSQKYFENTTELAPHVKKSGMTFLKYYKMLVKYTDRHDKSEIELNYNKMRSEKLMTAKSWLTSKFDKILK
ncbi:MAG: hypothetical protein KDC42_01555 [Ignavibacteriae bacterium]|nr:hypothetical protein [Ignavibacteriota bacterium]